MSLCRSETISFQAFENKRSLATDVAGTASSRLVTAATDGYFCRFVAHRTVDFGCAKVSAQRVASCQLLTHDLSRRSVVSGRRRRYSIAGLGGVQFVPQARRRYGVTCRCSGRWLWGAGVDSSLPLHEIDRGIHCLLFVVAIEWQQLEYGIDGCRCTPLLVSEHVRKAIVNVPQQYSVPNVEATSCGLQEMTQPIDNENDHRCCRIGCSR